MQQLLQFAHPEVLWWLAAPALLLLFLLGCSFRLRVVLPAVAFVAFAIVMAAGPQKVSHVQTTSYSGRVVVGLADDSGSMSRCLDPLSTYPCVTTYHDMATGFDSFTRVRQTDVVAVTLFSDSPLVLTDPSQPRTQTLTALAQAKPRFQGTEPLVALNSAIAQFKNAPEGARVLVIMSDGEYDISAQDLEAIGNQLKDLNVSVHWIMPDWDKAGPYEHDLYKLMQHVHGRIYEVGSRGDIGNAFLKIAVVEDPRLGPATKSITTDLMPYFAIPLLVCLLWFFVARCCGGDSTGGGGTGGGGSNSKGKRVPPGRDTVFDVGEGKIVIVRDTTR